MQTDKAKISLLRKKFDELRKNDNYTLEERGAIAIYEGMQMGFTIEQIDAIMSEDRINGFMRDRGINEKTANRLHSTTCKRDLNDPHKLNPTRERLRRKVNKK